MSRPEIACHQKPFTMQLKMIKLTTIKSKNFNKTKLKSKNNKMIIQ